MSPAAGGVTALSWLRGGRKKKKSPLNDFFGAGSGRLRALRGRGSGGRGASGGAPVDAVSWGALSRALPGRLRLAGSRRGAICRICPRAPARKASSSRSREKIFSEAGKKTGTCPQQPSLSSFSPASLPRERFCVLGKYGSGFFLFYFFFRAMLGVRDQDFGARGCGSDCNLLLQPPAAVLGAVWP